VLSNGAHETHSRLRHAARVGASGSAAANVVLWAIIIAWLVVLMLIGVTMFISTCQPIIEILPKNGVLGIDYRFWGVVVPSVIGCVAFVALPALFVIVVKRLNLKLRFWLESRGFLFLHVLAFALLAIVLRHLSREFRR